MFPNLCWVPLTVSSEFDNASGNHHGGRVVVIHQSQITQDVFKRGCKHTYFFRRKTRLGLVLLQECPNRHLPDAAPFTPPFTGPLIMHNRFTENIVRVGLNYKLGNYYVPGVSKTHRRNPRR